MKHLSILTGLLAALLSFDANAVTIGGIELVALANSLTGSSGNYYNYNSEGIEAPISFAQLTADLTDAEAGTYVVSRPTDPGSYIEMGFTGSNAVYNNSGADLALFFAGDFVTGPTDVFDIQINGITRSYMPETTPIPWIVTDRYTSFNLTVAMIELDDFGLAHSADALANFRVFLGNDTVPALSLVGGLNTQIPTIVPLPLPAFLFISGLGMLLFCRKPKLF